MSIRGVLQHYSQYLPLTDRTPNLSLGEGDTPLVRANAVSQETGCEVYLKLEGCNPTGSFKDRGMVVAMAKAVEEGAHAVICASTGNTSASAAAYAARVGLPCVVLIPSGQIARGKLAQAFVYGARILAIDGNFDRALELTRELGEAHNLAIVNSINPYRIQGQKTAAFEIVDDLGRAPDILALPVGNAGNITAYWKGFKEYATSPQPSPIEGEGDATSPQPSPTEGEGGATSPQPSPIEGEGDATSPQPSPIEGEGDATSPQPSPTEGEGVGRLLPKMWGFQA
ncbi:MAG: threonine synthase, partial [Chloroflexi bacterium]|nr:threonine synthase [Chloroflexota bacterium]